MAKEMLVTFPDFTKEFEVHMDASKLQLGACISQGGKPVAFYSKNWNPPKRAILVVQLNASYVVL